MNQLRYGILCLCMSFTYYTAMAQTAVLTGQINDFHTQQPIPFATISIKQLVRVIKYGNYANERIDFRNLATDSLGMFKLQMPFGEYVIEASALGHSKKSKYVPFKKNEHITLELSEQTNQLDDVEVKGKRAEDNVKNIESSVIKLNVQNIKKLPIVFGEGDIIKALTLQPGVTTAGEGAGGFNVRGGKVDQNLVLLDDAPIFNTSHLLGLFTSVNTETVQNATLYKSVMPARYGGRLSSLLNINTKSGTTDPKRSVGIGPISATGLFQQPFKDNKGSILLSSRVAYPNLMLEALPKRFSGSKASFYDVKAVFQYRFSSKNNLKITGYKSGDAFKFPEDTSYFWGSTAATIHWSSILSKRLSVNVKGILSHYIYGVNGLSKGLEYELKSVNRHHEIRADAMYQLKNHRIEWGIGGIDYRFSPASINPSSATSSIISKQLNDMLGRELSAYWSDEWQISKRISLQAGIRYAQFQNTSIGNSYLYIKDRPKTVENIIDTLQNAKDGTIYQGFEPRVSFKIELSDNQSIKGGYGRTRQFIHLISNTTAISPIDYWQLSNTHIQPQVAEQFSLGYYRNLQENTFETYIEGFYKNMNHLVEYKDGASLLLNNHLETELLSAIGKSYGVEVSIQKNKGRFTGNMSYTWSRSLVAVQSPFVSEQINQGKFYPSLYDKPHNLTLLGQYFLGEGWTFSGTFTYQTGRPITYPDGQYSYNQNLIFNYSDRNASRLPDYHRLDVSFSRDSRRNKNQKKYNVVNISFYNLYARQNPYSIFFKQYLNYGQAYSLSVLGTIVPSITITKYW
jgi:CarboxypepD_reg-like domain/TonB-dependent Receptor Plug Domain